MRDPSTSERERVYSHSEWDVKTTESYLNGLYSWLVRDESLEVQRHELQLLERANARSFDREGSDRLH